MKDLLHLSGDGIEVEVDLAAGGRLSRLAIEGHELLVDRVDDPLAWGCYPMVPFAGRVRDGRFEFAGNSHQLPTNAQPHAIHGFGLDSHWRQLDDATIGFDFAEPWPFRGSARQEFRLGDGEFISTIEVRAVDAQPVMVGWHPWFRRELADGSQLRLEVQPTAMYELDHQAIPTGMMVDPTSPPWDNCFHLAAPPVLSWGGALSVEVSSSCDHWVIYDQPAHAVCVEPQSGAPDEINRDPLIVVASDRLVHSMALRWH